MLLLLFLSSPPQPTNIPPIKTTKSHYKFKISENIKYQNFVESKCLRPSLSCKRPLRARLSSSWSAVQQFTELQSIEPRLSFPQAFSVPASLSESLSLTSTILRLARLERGHATFPIYYTPYTLALRLLRACYSTLRYNYTPKSPVASLKVSCQVRLAL